ncbi:proto-oncogene Mas-like isoform X1 [Myiozetetes cayanensis]|uniref:proto-oncogene Mas-like isoform X1 n=2 Tax=Myiozetetes cayanensis TaxID=478635 RepID=UPI00215E2D50|nr:proto-oncogene Mas-like isoform X1 [Myiozetetes cayanensis]
MSWSGATGSPGSGDPSEWLYRGSLKTGLIPKSCVRGRRSSTGVTMDTSPATERASPACWGKSGGMAPNGSWSEDNPYSWTDCESSHLSKVPVTLLICLCGMVGNGAVLWLLGFQIRRNPVTIFILNLAIADCTFLLSITLSLGIFYVPESLCHELGSQGVTTVLNITILFAFTASVYLLTAFSAVTALSVLPLSHCPCHHSQRFPVLLCALLWVLSFLLTTTLYFHPSALAAFVLSYLLSVLTLICSALTLLIVLCCSCKHPPRKLCAVVLLAVIFFPFFTADFGYWLLLRVFDFSVFVLSASLPLACANSSVHPLIYFLAGSCAKKFTLSVSAAFQRAFEDVSEPQNKDNTVESL